MQINAYGYQPQINNPAQTNAQNAQIGTSEQRSRTNEVQPREAAASESQRDDNRQRFSLQREDTRAEADRQQQPAPRGSLVDVVA